MRQINEINFTLNNIADKCQSGLAGYPEAVELRNIVGELQTVAKTLKNFETVTLDLVVGLSAYEATMEQSKAKLKEISYLSKTLSGEK